MAACPLKFRDHVPATKNTDDHQSIVALSLCGICPLCGEESVSEPAVKNTPSTCPKPAVDPLLHCPQSNGFAEKATYLRYKHLAHSKRIV